jgi:hypothetical protein
MDCVELCVEGGLQARNVASHHLRNIWAVVVVAVAVAVVVVVVVVVAVGLPVGHNPR